MSTCSFTRERVFVKKDTIPGMPLRSRTLEILEAKRNRASFSSERVAAEFLTFTLICTLVIVLIFLYMRHAKDDDDEDEMEEEEDVESVSDLLAINDEINCASTGDSVVCSVPADPKDNKNCDNLSVASNRILDVTKSFRAFAANPVTPSQASVLSIRDAESLASHCDNQLRRRPSVPLTNSRNLVRAHLQQSKKNYKCHHRRRQTKINDDESLIKRTRSGHIYGKYPF